MPVQVAVCGPRASTEQDDEHAYEVGRLLALAGATVLNGGGTGVMAAVSAGARSAGGLVVGIRPGATKDGANPDLGVVLATNMGEARNAILVWSADAVIVVGGSWGTLSELALAKRRGVPVISLGGWQILDVDGNPPPDAPPIAATPQDAVAFALTTAQRG
ncbi:TIGR00725 family protein [Promicromonospora soli]